MERGHLALIAIAVAFALGAQPAAAACGGAKHVRPAADRNPGRAPLAIGDSVLLGALGQVSRAGFEIDTRGCRQMREGLGVLRRRARAGTLPRFVVVALGSNLDITAEQIRAALRILGPRRVLGMVTPREDARDARVIRAAGRRHKQRLMVLDWAAHSVGRSGWFAGDGLHLGPGGAAGLARLLGGGLNRVYPLQARFVLAQHARAAHEARHDPGRD